MSGRIISTNNKVRTAVHDSGTTLIFGKDAKRRPKIENGETEATRGVEDLNFIVCV